MWRGCAPHTPPPSSPVVRGPTTARAPLWQSRTSIVAVGAGVVKFRAGKDCFWAKNLWGGADADADPPLPGSMGGGGSPPPYPTASVGIVGQPARRRAPMTRAPMMTLRGVTLSV